jgi:hypothetical protein
MRVHTIATSLLTIIFSMPPWADVSPRSVRERRAPPDAMPLTTDRDPEVVIAEARANLEDPEKKLSNAP